MKRLTLTLMFFCVCCGLAYAGTAYSGKEMKEVAPAPCPQWYADNEWNVSLWGTYAATGTEFAPNPSLADIVQSTTEGHTVYGTFDKYLGGDHAWGGGIDLRYFFRRYFGIGVEGFVLNAHRGAGFNLERAGGPSAGITERTSDNALLGKCWEPLRFVTRFSALAFLRTSGLVAVSSLVAVNGMKSYWTVSLRKDRFFILFIMAPAQKR